MAAVQAQQHKPTPLESFRSMPPNAFHSFHMTPTASLRTAVQTAGATSSTGSANFGSNGSGNFGSSGSVKISPTSAGVNPTGSYRFSPISSRRLVEATPVATTPISLWPPTPSPSGISHGTQALHPAVGSGYVVVQQGQEATGNAPKFTTFSSQSTVITQAPAATLTTAPAATTVTTTAAAAAPAAMAGSAPAAATSTATQQQMVQPMVFMAMPVPMPSQGQVPHQVMMQMPMPVQGQPMGQPMMVMAPQQAAGVPTLQGIPEAAHGVVGNPQHVVVPASASASTMSMTTTTMRTVMEVPSAAGENAEGGATAPSMSLGSALHSVGKCNPCAWYWKPKGCSVGANCDFCHLCPKGELNARKKAKVAAMRMGIIPPGTRTAPRAA